MIVHTPTYRICITRACVTRVLFRPWQHHILFISISMNRSFDQEVIRTCLKDEVFQKQLLLHRLSFELHSLPPDSDMQIPTNSIPAIQTIKSSLNTLEEASK